MQPSDQPTIVPTPESGNRSRRIRRAALAVALGGGLALGVGGLAYAADASTAPSVPRPDAATGRHRSHLDGTVQKIGSGKITIVDMDGFTRQINIASVPSGVVVGTRIHAEGTVNADGVSLDAASVVVAPAPGAGGPPKPGKGPGGAPDKDARPGGAPDKDARPGGAPGKDARPGGAPGRDAKPRAPPAPPAPAPSATS